MSTLQLRVRAFCCWHCFFAAKLLIIFFVFFFLMFGKSQATNDVWAGTSPLQVLLYSGIKLLIGKLRRQHVYMPSCLIHMEEKLHKYYTLWEINIFNIMPIIIDITFPTKLSVIRGQVLTLWTLENTDAVLRLKQKEVPSISWHPKMKRQVIWVLF